MITHSGVFFIIICWWEIRLNINFNNCSFSVKVVLTNSVHQVGNSASVHQAIRRLTAKSHEIWKAQDLMLELSCRVWQVSRQHCWRGACQISEPLAKSKPESRGFETLRDLTVRRLTVQWIEALNLIWHSLLKVGTTQFNYFSFSFFMCLYPFFMVLQHHNHFCSFDSNLLTKWSHLAHVHLTGILLKFII